MVKGFLLFFAFFLSGICVKAQAPIDSTGRVHSVRKATLLSTFIPGAGQVYNHKYWKLPLVYAGLGATFYYINYNNNNFKKYNEALLRRYDTDSTNELFSNISNDNLRILSDGYRRNRDLSFAAATIVYILNIIDAHVDAHLYTFNVSDDLTLKVEPCIIPSFANSPPHSELKFTLNF
ncbi:MAG: DUF5683 domain-containing protein [Bacteroidota bacterium]